MTARSLLPKGLAGALAEAAAEKKCEIVVERNGAVFRFRPSGSIKGAELDDAEAPSEKDIVL